MGGTCGDSILGLHSLPSLILKHPCRTAGAPGGIITEASRITSVRAMLPTQRGRDSYEVLDTTSNKFSIAAFWL